MAGILAGAFARSTPGTGRGISPRPVRGFCYPAGEHPPRRPRASGADDPATPPPPLALLTPRSRPRRDDDEDLPRVGDRPRRCVVAHPPARADPRDRARGRAPYTSRDASDLTAPRSLPLPVRRRSGADGDGHPRRASPHRPRPRRRPPRALAHRPQLRAYARAAARSAPPRPDPRRWLVSSILTLGSYSPPSPPVPPPSFARVIPGHLGLRPHEGGARRADGPPRRHVCHPRRPLRAQHARRGRDESGEEALESAREELNEGARGSTRLRPPSTAADFADFEYYT
jgi:hypothetical protein